MPFLIALRRRLQSVQTGLQHRAWLCIGLLLVVSVLGMQQAGWQHSIDHAGQSALLSAKAAGDAHSHSAKPVGKSTHSCAAFDGVTLAVAVCAALPHLPAVLARFTVADAQRTVQRYILTLRHFAARAPPLLQLR